MSASYRARIFNCLNFNVPLLCLFPNIIFKKTEIHAFFMFNKLLQYVKLPYIFFNRPIYICNYRYRKNQCITLIMAINQISNESQIQFSLRTFQTRTYNFINISMCVLVVYISILHKNYLQSSMRITFFFTTAIFTKVSYVHLSFPKVAGVKTIVYLKLRSPDAQPYKYPQG